MRHRRVVASALIFGFSAGFPLSASTAEHSVPLFPAASDANRQGFVRVINHSLQAGEVRIVAVDDSGHQTEPLTLTVGSDAAVHFNSDDLEQGNPDKGLNGAAGSGVGDWRLELATDLDIEVLSYIRTADGFLTAMHDVVPNEDDRYRVPIFNPGSNIDQVSLLRLTNPGDAEAAITIHGTDDLGDSTDRVVRTTVAAGASRTLTSEELESGGSGMEGRLGDGAGKWRLVVESDGPIRVMSLLSSPTGHLTNLSSVPVAAGGGHRVALFPSAADPNRQGFVRVINRSMEAGEIGIEAIDDFGLKRGDLTLAIGALGAAHFNSNDLELGNTDKGLSGSTGAGNGDWRLELTSELDLEVLSYIRTAGGFLTSMHDVVPIDGARHRVSIFNPARNVNQASRLRLVNLGEERADVAIVGVDDRGEATVPLPASLAPGTARTFTAADLETAFGLEGSLAGRLGKWRLWVESEDPTRSLVALLSDIRQPILAMSLLESPTGHLTNLSSARRCTGTGFRDALADGGEGPEMVVIPPGRFEMGCRRDDCGEAALPVHEVVFAQPFALSRTEVTFAQWDACVAAGGCNGYVPRDRFWGRGDRPVIYVGREDAEAYTAWLSDQTGVRYRLPSEAEWEYAARAGGYTQYSWGDVVGDGRANCAGCGGRWDSLGTLPLFLFGGGTAPVGTFAANAFCLHDMHGNVGEWVADWWNESYEGAPSDGSAWTAGDPAWHVARGGSWALPFGTMRSSDRLATTDERSAYAGFRVARTIGP